MMNLLLFLTLLSLSIVATAAQQQQKHPWLVAKSELEGVLPLGDEGLLYVKKVNGWGVYYPLDQAELVFFYQMFDMNDKRIEENPDDQPAILVSDITLPAIKLALSIMVEGDELELYVPAELGYSHTVEPFRLRIKLFDWIHRAGIPFELQGTYALTCDLVTRTGCTTLELQYAANFYVATRDQPDVMLHQIERLRENIRDGKVETPEDFNWWERRIFLLKQMAKLEEARLEAGLDDYLFPEPTDDEGIDAPEKVVQLENNTDEMYSKDEL